ncbi:MAG: cyclic peptide export ABC transporter [Planctomycetota bacterium]
MKTFRILVAHAPRDVASAGILGLAAGLGTAAMLALANSAISDPAQRTAAGGLQFLAVVTVVLIATAGSQIVLVRLAQGIVLDLQHRLLRAILAAPLPALERIGNPRLLAALTADVNAVSRAAPWIAGLWVNAVGLLGCLAYLAWLSPSLLAVLFGVLVAGGFVYRVLMMRGFSWIRAAHRARDDLYRHFRSVTEGLKELKIHQHWRERFAGHVFRTDAQRFRDARVRGTSIFALTGAWGVTLFFLAIGALVYVAPGVTAVDDAILMKYAVTILFMITPLRGLLNSVPEVGQANVALDRIEALDLDLDAAPSTTQSVAAHAAPTFHTITLEGVRFRFPQGDGEDTPFELGPIDFTLRAGERVFLVGGNGSGKSTLAKVLTGLYPIAGGRILVDGQPVDAADGPNDGGRMDDYRAHFSGVFAEGFVFDELLGPSPEEPSANGEVQRLLERLELTRRVRVEGRRFSTTALSTGQRKRLGLLATCLEPRPVYVFDEWAAEQDPRFKEVFYRELLPELARQGKTVVAITHDDRYFDGADRVVRLDEGKIVEDEAVTVAGRAP